MKVAIHTGIHGLGTIKSKGNSIKDLSQGGREVIESFRPEQNPNLLVSHPILHLLLHLGFSQALGASHQVHDPLGNVGAALLGSALQIPQVLFILVYEI